jgi:hypothetical protein
MKTNLLYLILMVAAISFNACKKDEVQVPKLAPTVVTGGAVSVSLSSATVAGTVTNDGNAKLTATGIVYSSNVSLPTVVDNKKELTDGKSDFTVVLDGLSSGTTYHARAYATNSAGTGYGAVVDFATGNAPPVVTNVTVTGTLEVNKTLTATYTYADAENNAEGASTFQWFAATSSAGAGETAIAGAIAKTLVVQEAQNGKFLRVSVTPKATTGTAEGVEVKSAYTGAVGAETVTFSYNGQTITYGTIISSITQKKWLDRNLGATRAAQSITDYVAYGDLFQWGRSADGHQFVTRTGLTDADATGVSPMTSTVAPYETSSTDVPPNSKFIIVKGGTTPRDWRDPQNNQLWQGVNGTNNPCPTGWRIPTLTEFKEEVFQNGSDAFARLKLTLTGQRYGNDGTINDSNYGAYWSSTTLEFTPGQFGSVYGVGFNTTALHVDYGDPDPNQGFYDVRRTGKALRCIKN